MTRPSRPFSFNSRPPILQSGVVPLFLSCWPFYFQTVTIPEFAKSIRNSLLLPRTHRFLRLLGLKTVLLLDFLHNRPSTPPPPHTWILFREHGLPCLNGIAINIINLPPNGGQKTWSIFWIVVKSKADVSGQCHMKAYK